MQAFNGREDIALVACGYSVRESDGKTIIRDVLRKNYQTHKDLFQALSLCQLIPGCASGVVVKKKCFSEIGSFDTTLRIGEDWDMWLRVVSQYNAYFVEQVLVVIRQANNSKANRTAKDEEYYVQRVIEKTVQKEFKNRALAVLYARLGSNALSGGNTIQALKWLARSIALYPASVFPLDLRNKYQYPNVWRSYLFGKCILKLAFKYVFPFK